MTHDQDYYPGANRERADKGVWLKVNNTDAIEQSGLPYSSLRGGDVLVFRSTGKASVDYFPAKNRWQVRGAKKTTHGTVREFIAFIRQFYSTELGDGFVILGHKSHGQTGELLAMNPDGQLERLPIETFGGQTGKAIAAALKPSQRAVAIYLSPRV